MNEPDEADGDIGAEKEFLRPGLEMGKSGGEEHRRGHKVHSGTHFKPTFNEE